LTGAYRGAAAWGDYDNDGDLDLLLTGFMNPGLISKIYRNNGGSFNDIGAGLPSVQNGAVAWGDYDNDGDLDLLLTGDTGSAPISKVYRNDGGSFIDLNAALIAFPVQSKFASTIPALLLAMSPRQNFCITRTALGLTSPRH